MGNNAIDRLGFNQTAPVLITQALKPYQHRSAQAPPKLPSLATPWVELGYTLGRAWVEYVKSVANTTLVAWLVDD